MIKMLLPNSHEKIRYIGQSFPPESKNDPNKQKNRSRGGLILKPSLYSNTYLSDLRIYRLRHPAFLFLDIFRFQEITLGSGQLFKVFTTAVTEAMDCAISPLWRGRY